MDQAAVDAAKANLYEGYKHAANLVRARTAAIQQSYSDIQSDITNNATRRTAANDQIGAAQQGGMDSAAKALGLNVTPPVGGARAFADRDEARYGADAEGWKTFLEVAKNAQAGRNVAVGDNFEHRGAAVAQELQDQFLQSLMSGSGGGGGGGGGGRGRGGGAEDDGRVYPNRVEQMTPGVARGLAATSIRDTKRASHGTPQQFTSAMQKLLANSRKPSAASKLAPPKTPSGLTFWSR